MKNRGFSKFSASNLNTQELVAFSYEERKQLEN
jgi:hypothetical protein